MSFGSLRVSDELIEIEQKGIRRRIPGSNIGLCVRYVEATNFKHVLQQLIARNPNLAAKKSLKASEFRDQCRYQALARTVIDGWFTVLNEETGESRDEVQLEEGGRWIEYSPKRMEAILLDPRQRLVRDSVEAWCSDEESYEEHLEEVAGNSDSSSDGSSRPSGSSNLLADES